MITAVADLLALNQVLATFRSRSIEARHADTRVDHHSFLDLPNILLLVSSKSQSL
jgi:hypothetical protein